MNEGKDCFFVPGFGLDDKDGPRHEVEHLKFYRSHLTPSKRSNISCGLLLLDTVAI